MNIKLKRILFLAASPFLAVMCVCVAMALDYLFSDVPYSCDGGEPGA